MIRCIPALVVYVAVYTCSYSASYNIIGHCLAYNRSIVYINFMVILDRSLFVIFCTQ